MTGTDDDMSDRPTSGIVERGAASARRRLRAAANVLPDPLSPAVHDELRRALDAERERTAKLERTVRQLEDKVGRRDRALAAEADRRRFNGERVIRYARAYRGLRAAGLDVEPATLGEPSPDAPDPKERAVAERSVRDTVRLSAFLHVLARGEGLEAAIADLVRLVPGSTESGTIRRVAEWLHANEATRTAGLLGTGLLAHRSGLPQFAWERLTELPDEVWLAHAVDEYVLLAGEFDRDELVRAVGLLTAAEASLLPARTWNNVLRRCIGYDLVEPVPTLLARLSEAVALAEASSDVDADALARDRADLEWARRWVPRVVAGAPPEPELAEGAVAFGVMGYDQPDLRSTSTNIGDYVQTIASLAHLARQTGVRFGDDELGRFAARLQQRVSRALRVEGPEREVALFQVDRDASHWSAVPDGTWLLAFGWYAHRIGGVRHDFPFTDRVRPIFVSFHVNRRTMLDETSIEYLRKHAPIGCRDWTTVDILLGLGIPAFFSGCLTTTVRYVKPDDAPRPAPDAPDLYVDAPAPKGAETVRNERPEVATASLAENLDVALASLDRYTSEVGRVITKRLHSYLPARALGREVDFVPGNPADIRFHGLAPLTDAEVHAMGAGIAEILEPPMWAILAGEPEEEVRRRWAEAVEPLVVAAKERHEADVELPSMLDTAAAAAAIRARRVRVERTAAGPQGEELHVVLALDGNLKAQFRVVVDAMVRNTTRPLVLHVLCRDHDQTDIDALARLFPTITFDWLPCDAVQYGEIRSMIPHITVSTMDRLLLPEVLDDVPRVIYHDIDTLPLGDLAELDEADLEGHPLAGRDSEVSQMRSGYEAIFGPASRTGLDPEVAADLIRRETARHPFDFVGFNAGILVMDLDRMRADDFCRRFVPYASCFGMHDQQILNLYTGANRASLEPKWNARPTQETVVDPAIIHWAGARKPWTPDYVPLKELWTAQEAMLEERERAAGVAPACAEQSTEAGVSHDTPARERVDSEAVAPGAPGYDVDPSDRGE